MTSAARKHLVHWLPPGGSTLWGTWPLCRRVIGIVCRSQWRPFAIVEVVITRVPQAALSSARLPDRTQTIRTQSRGRWKKRLKRRGAGLTDTLPRVSTNGESRSLRLGQLKYRVLLWPRPSLCDTAGGMEGKDRGTVLYLGRDGKVHSRRHDCRSAYLASLLRRRQVGDSVDLCYQMYNTSVCVYWVTRVAVVSGKRCDRTIYGNMLAELVC